MVQRRWESDVVHALRYNSRAATVHCSLDAIYTNWRGCHATPRRDANPSRLLYCCKTFSPSFSSTSRYVPSGDEEQRRRARRTRRLARLIEIETNSARCRASRRTFIARSAIIRFSVTVDFTASRPARPPAGTRSSDTTKLRSQRFMDFHLACSRAVSHADRIKKTR